MDGTTIALLVTSVSGALLGAAGLWQSFHRDTAAAAATASDVATKTANVALSALNAALDRQQLEISGQQVEIATLTSEVRELRGDVRRCETEKQGLARELAALRAEM